MKLINNRFRVTGIINQGEIEESYIVKDLQQKEKIKFLTIYNAKRDKKVIEYLTDEYQPIVNVKHSNLIKLEEFDIVESINLKISNQLIYYVLSEYIESPRLVDLNKNLDLDTTLKIILQLMSVIDYLHFRGYIYRHLSPGNIFICDDYRVKIRDLASIYRHFVYSHHDYLTELFIAPETFSNNDESNKYVDYYSIGMIMKYLLFKGLNIEDVSKNNFKDEFNLTENQKVFLLNTIKNLTHKDAAFRNISLLNHIKNIVRSFKLDFDCDLVKERDHLILSTSIIGREKEISTLLEIDDSIAKGIKKFNGVIITGRSGSGKTKLLNEVGFRFGLLNRPILHLKGREDITSGGLNIATLLKASFKYAPNDLINKYNDDFSCLLEHNLPKTTQQKYYLYNRLADYFADLSKNRTIYILIDDINVANEDFISFLNYLMFRLDNHKVFLIATSVDSVLVQNKINVKNLRVMINQDSVLHLELDNLNETETGKFVMAVLGVSYVPLRFSSFIYKESLGNPNYINYILKDLYKREELYMSEKGEWETIEKDYNKIIISIDENHLINNQLESIDEDNYKILELISTSKDMITRETLTEMLKIHEERLNSVIRSLIESKIIDVKIDGNKETLTIYSTELKKTVYSRIDYSNRIKLHKEAASTILKLYEDDYSFMMEELIHHHIYSNQKDLALNIVLSEALKQTNRFSSYSIYLWEHAYNLVKDTDNEVILDILNSLITIYEMKGYVELIGGYITKMHKIALETNNLEYVIKAIYHQIEIYLNANQIDIAVELISEIEKIIQDNKDLYEGRILFLISKSKLGFSTSKLDNMVDDLNEAIRLSKENNILKYLGNIYNLYGLYYYMNGMSKEALEYFNKSIIAFDIDGHIVEEIKPINNIGNIYANVYGEEAEALEYFLKGYKIASKYEFAKASSVFTSNIGDIYYRDFKLEEALQYFETSRNISNEIGDYRGTIISNLNLGMIYLRGDRCDKADEVYDFIEEINNKEPIVDSEILTIYYTFMAKYNDHYGRLEESLNFYKLLSDISKDFNDRNYLYAESNILIIKAFKYSDYNRDKLEKIIDVYKLSKLNNMELEILLIFASLAVMFKDRDFAEDILKIYSEISDDSNESLRALRDTLDLCINPSVEKLLYLENYQYKKIYRDYKLFIHKVLASEWAVLYNYSRAISHSFKSLDNIMKRAETIKDKELIYCFIAKRDGDKLKFDLSKYIELEFSRTIDYISLDEALRTNERYNDLIYILKQLDSSEYRKIKNLDNKYEEMDSIETLINEFTDDYQRNLDLTLNYLGYETLANRGFILMLNEDDNSYKIISSLVEGDTYVPRENLLSQSNRSSVGILINKNLRNMEDSKYMELMPEEAVGIICVPLTDDINDKIKIDRRKKNTISQVRNHTLFEKPKIFIYFETNSYLNRFEYEELILINQIASLIQINVENKYLRDLTVIDKLTGVMTRKYFDLQIDNIINRYNKFQGTFSIIMIDIDNFKGLNDTYGHLVGDDVLSLIGRKLLESVRSTDLVARYGGEEFIIVLFETTIEEGMNIAEKIRKNVSTIKVPNMVREITVSIGLAQYPDHSQTKKELIGKADQALYIAKEKRGKNNSVIWTIDMGEGSNNQNKLAGILTGNINKDNVNISAVINTVELIQSKNSESEKIAEFTSRMLEVLEAQYSTFIKCQYNDMEHPYLYKTKIRNIPEWVNTPKLNMEIINRVITNEKGEFLVDWDNSEYLDPITEEPVWQSILVIPLIRNDIVLGLMYLSAPFKEKEFTFDDYNLGNLLSNIFAAGLEM
ncbi:MAG: diguanylate cyclase [Tissierellaceae bacterium]|nr:diguanylate cyclase [Tissierellaceae bacterium]